ncbi:ABC transporter substrate-binding protein [Photobacterium damselae]|uniref:ABC transporter substrate-binding protein n=1 Tax=Photobacterium damselae TaxID=38293 RepID=UPI00406783B9
MNKKIIGFCFAFILGLNPVNALAITVTDMIQNQVYIDSPPKRAAIATVPIASLLISLTGQPEHLVGVHPFAKETLLDSTLGQYYPQLKTLETDVIARNFTPNIEALLALHVDLVVQWGHLNPKLYKRLQAAQIPTITLLYGTEDYSQQWIKIMGEISGQSDKASHLLTQRKAWIEKLQQQQQRYQTKPKVLYLSSCKGSRCFSMSGNSNVQFDIELAGGINLTQDIDTQQNTSINMEQIIEWDPDIILLGNFDKNFMPQDIEKNALLSYTTAAKKHQIYKIPQAGFIWDVPSHENPAYWLWLSAIFHPSAPIKLTTIDLKQMIKQWYGIELTPQDIKEILKTDINRYDARLQFDR